MDYPEHYESDVLSFFDGRPDALALYRVLAAGLARIAPEGRVKVQKSQISFYDGGLFAMASLPKRPYPGRWTHHAALTREADLDGELLGWLEEARGFCRAKGRGKA